jgi:cytochrome c peroxidase
MPLLHHDGEFSSLEDLVKLTIAGRPMGWLPGEEGQAYEHARRVLVGDAAYQREFSRAYQTRLEQLSNNEVLDLVARAVSAYLRTLKSGRTSPYDQFVRANLVIDEPKPGESVVAFAQSLLKQILQRESQGNLKLVRGFDAGALKGFKTFLRLDAGNCVTCHQPPLFTDLSFHNIGISQAEYDKLHGEGSFAALAVPDARSANRPVAKFREIPSRRKPGEVDLGHWNFVNLANSPLRKAGETDNQFLERMIGTFKTPTLRNLAYTNPYMHNGAYSSLEEALSELVRLSALTRSGRVRSPDPELSKVRITEDDVPSLAAFLMALNEEISALKGR